MYLFSAVKGKTPQVGDRVLVEAVYNPNMPFKWNAQRIQTLPQLANQSVRTLGHTEKRREIWTPKSEIYSFILNLGQFTQLSLRRVLKYLSVMLFFFLQI